VRSLPLALEPYIALADDETFDFRWSDKEIKTVLAGWRGGLSIWKIADRIRRDPDEVMILLIDLARRGAIKPRPGWVWGGE